MLQHSECPTAALCWGWALPGALKQPRSFQEITRLEQQGVGRGTECVPSSLGAQALLQSTYNRFGAGLDTVRKGLEWFNQSQSL